MDTVNLEKIDIIRARLSVSYREAKDALERNAGNVVEALIELENRKTSNWTEEFSVRSGEVIDKVKQLIHDGNVTKIVVKADGRTLAEIPVTIGAIGAVILPQLAALGVLVAVFKRCTIEVLRSDGATDTLQADEREEDKR